MAENTRTTVFVKPAEGSLIRHPASFRVMPATGFEIKPNDPHRGYWNRMMRTGDLVASPRPAARAPGHAPKKEG
jgi:hypothetical protein